MEHVYKYKSSKVLFAFHARTMLAFPLLSLVLQDSLPDWMQIHVLWTLACVYS